MSEEEMNKNENVEESSEQEEKVEEPVENQEDAPDAEKSESEEEELEDESKLPFPRATIVNMMRSYLDPGKQIKAQVKDEMNKWLGLMVERVSKKMNSFPYSYVDYAMFKEAIEVYEKLEDIEMERQRLLAYMDKIKADCDLLARDVDRRFRL